MEILLSRSGRGQEEVLVLPLPQKQNQKGEILALIRTAGKAFDASLGQTYAIKTDDNRRVLLLGLGEKPDAESVRRAIAVSIQELKKTKTKSAAVLVTKVAGLSTQSFVCGIVEGSVLGSYAFDRYKKDKTKPRSKLTIRCEDADKELEREVVFRMGVCENVNFVRDMVNETSDTLNPLSFSKLAKKVLRGRNIRISVIDERGMKKLGMNLLLSVGRGSRYPPRLLVVEYRGGRGKKVAVVGKGVTFDSGGINLKPSGYIENMKDDKAGAATVLGVMKTLKELGVRRNVVGVMPCCENMIGPNAQKPGSITRSYSGQTVEVIDTDAEGRLILADALAFVEERFKPAIIVDFATLTGSILSTFGEYVAGAFTNNPKLYERMFEASKRTGERIWELPVYDDYKEEMKGEISDLKNLGYKNGRYGGAITGAAFLSNFVSKTPWLHLDIAGTAWSDKPRWYTAQGGTGFGLRLLIEFLTSENPDLL